MHSTQFTAIARLADRAGNVIVAMADLADSPGTYPAAWVILRNPDIDGTRDCTVALAVLPPEDSREEAHLTWGHYDMSMPRAWEVFGEKVQRDTIRKGS